MKKLNTGKKSDRAPPSGNQASQPTDKPENLAGKQLHAEKSNKKQTSIVAGRLKELETRLADDLPIDTQRINDMKNAIANGEYQVDAESIANKMIDFESSLKK